MVRAVLDAIAPVPAVLLALAVARRGEGQLARELFRPDARVGIARGFVGQPGRQPVPVLGESLQGGGPHPNDVGDEGQPRPGKRLVNHVADELDGPVKLPDGGLQDTFGIAARCERAPASSREAKASPDGASPGTGPMLRSGTPGLVRQELAAWAAVTEMTRDAALAGIPARKGRRVGQPEQGAAVGRIIECPNTPRLVRRCRQACRWRTRRLGSRGRPFRLGR